MFHHWSTGTTLQAVVGASWTTDAPFRETAEAIEAAREEGILAVKMEAAALYTFARIAGVRCCALPTSLTLWGRLTMISKRERLMYA
jgi:purine-nucleoside phosphorylase